VFHMSYTIFYSFLPFILCIFPFMITIYFLLCLSQELTLCLNWIDIHLILPSVYSNILLKSVLFIFCFSIFLKGRIIVITKFLLAYPQNLDDLWVGFECLSGFLLSFYFCSCALAISGNFSFYVGQGVWHTWWCFTLPLLIQTTNKWSF
jgi:hypothetical protein